MKNRFVKSGLDLEAKMNELDQKAEKEKDVQQEAVNLRELAVELRQVAGDVRYLVPKVRELSASIERAGQQLEEAGKEGNMTYSLFQCTLAKANAEGIQINASPESLNALNYQCNTIKDDIIDGLKKSLDTTFNSYVEKHKLRLEELDRNEHTRLLTFQCDMNNALSHYGFWCSPKVFWWIFYLFMSCFIITLLVIVFLMTDVLRF